MSQVHLATRQTTEAEGLPCKSNKQGTRRPCKKHKQFMWEVRVYVCIREMVKDKTGLESLAGAR